MKTLLSILALVFILLEPLSFVYGDILEVQNMNVYTNKDSYGKGEVIRISGEIQSANGLTVSKDIPITIVITNGALHKTMEILKTYPSTNGNFAATGIPTTNSIWQSSGIYTIAASYGNIINSTTMFSFEVGDKNLLVSLKQSELGIPSDKIECRSDLQSITKAEDNSTACVTHQAIQTLVKRGWARTNSQESPIDITGLNTKYSAGQPINATVNFTGWMNGGLYPDVKILNADNGSKVWSNCFYTHTEPAGGGVIGTGTYNVRCLDKYPVINQTGNYIMIASVDNNIAKERFAVVKPLLLPASFEPCDTPYLESAGIAVLYMPANSTGKICIQYSNPNTPQPAGIRIFEAQHIMEDTNDVTSYATPDAIPTGNNIIVYTITTKNNVGFYGLTVFCGGIPLAVGYDDKSNFTLNDFPWEKSQTIYCPMMTYQYKIDSLSGIGVKYIPYS